MKTRESGVPDETIWAGFFCPEQTLAAMGLTSACGDAVDLGCGYGTFTIPAARIVGGTVHALDIEPRMIDVTACKAVEAGLDNVRVQHRDFVLRGTGLAETSVDYVMLFNLLHCERPADLLSEAWRVLAPGGRLGIMHWNHDPATPRGPSLDIRPRPEQCRDWAQTVGFVATTTEPIDLPPYHYAWVMKK